MVSLSGYADLADCWLVGSDFNMIEDAIDRLGGVGTTISGWEAKCWDYFCFAFGLLDLWKVHFMHTRILSILSIGWECDCYKIVSTR